jgi:hypothetical protein
MEQAARAILAEREMLNAALAPLRGARAPGCPTTIANVAKEAWVGGGTFGSRSALCDTLVQRDGLRV